MVVGKIAEKFFYDFSLYKTYLSKSMSYEQYVALRHNLLLVGGFYAILNSAWPFKPAFPTMGLCPSGWQGTWVCESDNHKAYEMYKRWKAGVKEEPAAAAAAASH